MKLVRLYTGNDHKSHFEDIELKFGGNQPMSTTDSRAATSAVSRSAPAGLFLDRHPAPRRQFLVTLSGSWEIEASNGVKRIFKTGDACSPTIPVGRVIPLASSATSPIFS